MPRSSRRLPIKLMEESDSDQDKSSGGDKLHASEISRTSGNSRDGRSSPGLSSTSSCLEFRPEDWEWLSEVLLQPLGSLKLASSVSSLSQVPIEPAMYDDVKGFIGELLGTDYGLASNPPEDIGIGQLRLLSQGEQAEAMQLALQQAVVAAEGNLGPSGTEQPPDFIATADEMKKIFQVSYCDKEVSILLHRVGGTLHLDGDFDVSWLRGENEANPQSGSKSKPAASGTSMSQPPSSFMVYSVAEASGSGMEEDPIQGTAMREFRASLKREKGRWQDGAKAGDIKRVFQWKFNDVAMLLGSDSIILSTSTRQPVRMYMRDIEEQISSAACLDLWLDNLMSGAEELALCYHKEGVMQGYQLLRTNDIPSLAHCHHLVTECNENAAQLLKLIKGKCSQDGASYVLRKAPGSSVIHVYRVKLAGADEDAANEESAPCSSTAPAAQGASGTVATPRPFSYAMAILCYRMALKLMSASEESGTLAQCRKLLQQCAALVEQAEHPRLWASAYMHIADVLLKEDELSRKQCDSGKESSTCLVEHKMAHMSIQRIPRIQSLSLAVDYVGRAINCLSFYQPISTHQLAQMNMKAADLFCLLAEECNKHDLLGRAFRMVRFSACHLMAASNRGPKEITGTWERHMARRLLCCSADAHNHLARNLTRLCGATNSIEHSMYFHKQDLNGLSTGSVVAHNGEDSDTPSGIPTPKDLSPDVETNLNYAVQQYLGCLKLFKARDEDEAAYACVVKSLSEMYKELGSILKNSGRYTRAHQHFKQGIPLFQSVGADLCVVDCHLELGRLSAERIKGLDITSLHALGELHKMALRSIKSFNAALACLGPRSSTSPLCFKIREELATVLVKSGGSLEIGLPLSKDPEELGNVAVGMYRDALKNYGEMASALAQEREVNQANGVGRSRPPISNTVHESEYVANAAASVHHQAARLYGQLARLAKGTRAESEDVRRARLLSLALSHLEKAHVTYTIDKHPMNYMRLQMDACALERQLPPPRGVIKTLETALERLLDCSEVFDPSHHCNCNAGACGCGLTAAEATAHDFSRCPPGFWTPTCPAAVWKITESELNHLLRDLIHARNGSPNSRGNKERLECLKAMYRTSLTQREHCRPNELLLLIKQQYLEVHRPGGGNSR